MRIALKTLTLGTAATAALALGACGSDSNSSSGGKAASDTKIDLASGGKTGGKLTFVAAADVDYLDPGQTYYTFGFMVTGATQRALYSFKPDDSVTPVPDLAAGAPEISSDNKTITIKIRKGVKFSPPVNREVTSKDIKYAFERAFSANVPSGYAGAYFSSIVGAPKAGSGPIKEIPGIETPDDQTLVLKLKEAQAPLVSQALVLPITVPVPKEYASKFDAKTPSTYDQHVAFTGPYMVKNDSSGKLIGRKPGKLIQLVRNPNASKSTGDFRPAYLDSVDIEEGNDDLTVASRRTLDGSNLVCCDSGSPPAPVLKQAVTSKKDQIAFVPSGGTRYIALNTTIKPLDNLNVRKAILAGVDRNALRLTRGGALLGDIANGWIPPGIPGYEEAGGLKQGTAKNDFIASPTGDAELAKKYMLAAKAEGVPVTADGKYAGSEKLLMIGSNADPAKKTAQVALDQFTKLGFKINLRIVPQDTLYTKFCGVPKAKVAICPNVGWFKDFSDPQAMLDATFNGKNILQQGNVNWPQLNDPKINAAMAKAATAPVGPERNKAWAAINDQIIADAPAIPWIWDKTALIASANVKMVPNTYTTTPDLSYTSIK